jgi:hypothetical protein
MHQRTKDLMLPSRKGTVGRHAAVYFKNVLPLIRVTQFSTTNQLVCKIVSLVLCLCSVYKATSNRRSFCSPLLLLVLLLTLTWLPVIECLTCGAEDVCTTDDNGKNWYYMANPYQNCDTVCTKFVQFYLENKWRCRAKCSVKG